MKKYIKPSMAIASMENMDNILLTLSGGEGYGGEDPTGLGYSKRMDELECEELIDNGMWKKNRW